MFRLSHLRQDSDATIKYNEVPESEDEDALSENGEVSNVKVLHTIPATNRPGRSRLWKFCLASSVVIALAVSSLLLKHNPISSPITREAITSRSANIHPDFIAGLTNESSLEALADNCPPE